MPDKGKVFNVSWTTVRRAKQLASDGIASIVVSFIKNARELNQCNLGGFVVLPDEVHVVIAPKGNHTCETIIRYIKRASERLINREINRTGEVWDAATVEFTIKTEKALAEALRKIEYLPCNRNIVKYPSDFPHTHLHHKDSLDDLSEMLEG